jgi:predicted esterase
MAMSSSVKKLIDTAYIIESKGSHHHSIIWLHGFGDSSDGYKDLFTQMQLPNTRIILPNAPKRRLIIQGQQYHLQSWYEQDEKAIENRLEVLESIKELINNELKLVDNASQIIIGGFRYLFRYFFMIKITFVYF